MSLFDLDHGNRSLHCICYPANRSAALTPDHPFPPRSANSSTTTVLPNNFLPTRHSYSRSANHTVAATAWNQLIAETFGECVWDDIQLAGFICGMLSIGFWIVCQTPQFVRNCRNKSVAALSGWFLAEWALGDTLNLVSAFLTNQLSTQKFTAMLFVFMDTCLLTQFLYYTYIYHDEDREDAEFQKSSSPNKKTKGPYLDAYQGTYQDIYGVTGKEPLLKNHRDYRLYGQRNTHAIMHENEYGNVAVTLGGGTVGENNPHDNHKTVDESLLDSYERKLKNRTNNKTANSLLSSTSASLTSTNSSSGAQSAKVAATTVAGLLSFAAFLSIRSDGASDEQQQVSTTVGRSVLTTSVVGRLPHRHPLPPCDMLPISAEIRAIGDVFAWTSGMIYLCSRVPQILKNYQRKSVEGLSFFMFFCAIMGNLLYALGILLRATQWSDITNSLPFLVGSIGTITFDMVILGQFCLYSYRNRGLAETRGIRRKQILKDSSLPVDKIRRGVHDIVAPGASPVWGTPSDFTVLTPEYPTVDERKDRATLTGYKV